MDYFKKIIFILILLVVFLIPSVWAEGSLRLATTTSTYETGLLDYIFPPFEKQHNVKIHIISVGTGKAIKLGENGDVDIILVHARKAEDKFVQQGYGVNRRDVMHNDFIILGPQNDPAGIKGLKKAGKAFAEIYTSKSGFVSRGDDSGTHKKERSIWEKVNLKPQGEWYWESGQGMNATLKMADEKNAYVMVDRGTYLFSKDTLRLEIAVEGDEVLFNPYGVIAVNPSRHPHAKYELSMALIAWLTSPECQELINSFKINGQQLFIADADK